MKEFLVLSAIGLVALSACAALQSRLGPRAAEVVNSYCQKPESARLALRQEVNFLIAPHSVEISCAAAPQ